MKKLNTWTLRTYCCNNNLFTCGSIDQYARIMCMCNDDISTIHDIAVAIWICSVTTKTVADIEKDLNSLED